MLIFANGTVLNLALLINARWEEGADGTRRYRLDFLQYPETLVVFLEHPDDVEAVHAAIRRREDGHAR